MTDVGQGRDPRDPGYDETYDEPYAAYGDDPSVEPDRVLDEYPAEGGRRRRKSRLRSIPGCLAALAAPAVLFGGLYFVATRGVYLLKDRLASPGDFAGPPRGKVVFEVQSGDTVAQMG